MAPPGPAGPPMGPMAGARAGLLLLLLLHRRLGRRGVVLLLGGGRRCAVLLHGLEGVLHHPEHDFGLEERLGQLGVRYEDPSRLRAAVRDQVLHLRHDLVQLLSRHVGESLRELV